MHDLFRRFAHKTSDLVGSPWAFVIAIVIIAVWALSGPIFDYSNTWQLLINTGTTIFTMLVVILVQNTQNRDARATHLKLDELIHALRNARDKIIDAEEFTDEELEKYTHALQQVAEKRQTRKRE